MNGSWAIGMQTEKLTTWNSRDALHQETASKHEHSALQAVSSKCECLFLTVKAYCRSSLLLSSETVNILDVAFRRMIAYLASGQQCDDDTRTCVGGRWEEMELNLKW